MQIPWNIFAGWESREDCLLFLRGACSHENCMLSPEGEDENCFSVHGEEVAVKVAAVTGS